MDSRVRGNDEFQAAHELVSVLKPGFEARSSFPRKRESIWASCTWIPACAGMTMAYDRDSGFRMNTSSGWRCSRRLDIIARCDMERLTANAFSLT